MSKDFFAEFIIKHYNRDWPYSRVDICRFRKILSLVGSGKKVLDIGCGFGYLGKLLIGTGNEVYGVDIAEEALKKAAEDGIKTRVANVESEIPFADSSFDVVVAAEIIEHLRDTDLFLEEVRRILKPGGFLVLTTPNFLSLGRRIFYLLGRNAYHEASFTFPPTPAGHLRYFSKDLLLGFLRYRHFEIVSFGSDVVNFTADPNSSLYSVLLAKLFPTWGKSLIVKCRTRK